MARSSNGNTPLCCAARNGRLDAAHSLLEHERTIDKPGEQLEATNCELWSPLTFAAVVGSQAVAELLLSNGASVNHKDDNGMSALHHAARRGHASLIQVLLDAGADIEARDMR